MARLMARMLEGSKSTISFVDGLFTCSSKEKGWEGHLNDIRDLFRRVKEANIKLKACKLNIHSPTHEILGFLYTSEKAAFSIPIKKIEAVKNFKKPNSVKSLRGYIAFVSYYRKFLYKFAELCVP